LWRMWDLHDKEIHREELVDENCGVPSLRFAKMLQFLKAKKRRRGMMKEIL
jgi:hypothetical protein